MIEFLNYLLYFVFTSLIGVISAAIIYVRWYYGTLERIKGLPIVIKPSFVGGSDFSVYKKVVYEEDSRNVEKYGKIFGYYEGRQPMIFIADPELIRIIFIKDFDHFHNKRILDFGHELINEMMDILPYDKWKLVRTFISPTLTTGKIRGMSLAMTDAIDDWLITVKEKLGNKEPFVTRDMYIALTGSVIARCAFATKINCLDADRQSSQFTKHLKLLSTEDYDMDFFLSLAHMFPFISQYFPFMPSETLEYFRAVIKGVMKTRRAQNIRVNDFVDCLNDFMEKVENDEEYKRTGITETTIMCQAMIFLFAGFETTATTLSLVTYYLSKNLDKQAKLLEEVDAYLERHSGKIEHETIGELPYMAACIHETLRLHAPLIRLERVCNKDWYHEPTGLHIPAGVAVQVPVYHIHYNEKYFPEPHSFKPERFLPENKEKLNPYSVLFFGQGNHNCVGMRFAREEMYLTLTNILKHFEFRENSNTIIKPKTGRTFIIHFAPFEVDVIERGK